MGDYTYVGWPTIPGFAVTSIGKAINQGVLIQYVIQQTRYIITGGNPCRSIAFMLCCDDPERENSNQKKIDKMYTL